MLSAQDLDSSEFKYKKILDEAIVAEISYGDGGEFWSAEMSVKLYLVNDIYILNWNQVSHSAIGRSGSSQDWCSKDIEKVLKKVDEFTKKNISNQLKNDMIKRLAAIKD